ncbi:MAG: precorrin-2 C(20)-methyltransferase [Rhodobiaceae bacterium]|nr:precorrin-2 C(20)-methyltransferase [Rhodobiaceae bacterium]
MKQGILYGVGLGPGDQELMTLKAARIVSAAKLIAYPADENGASFARRIAAAQISPGAEEMPVPIPMRVERDPARRAYDKGAEAIAARLEKGEDVVFLCAGDPLFYASFMYLLARLGSRFEVEIVPGVTSLTAVAARLARPLAARSDVLKVLPATLPEARLREELKTAQAAAIIKVGRHFDKVRAILDDLDLTARAAIVTDASLGDERAGPLSEVPAGARPYFSTILIYAGAEQW